MCLSSTSYHCLIRGDGVCLSSTSYHCLIRGDGVCLSHSITSGMNYLHFEAPIPVIHRDLKSKNGQLQLEARLRECLFSLLSSCTYSCHSCRSYGKGLEP